VKGEGGREGEGENEGGRGEEREQGFCVWVLLLIRNFKKSKKNLFFSFLLLFFHNVFLCLQQKRAGFECVRGALKQKR